MKRCPNCDKPTKRTEDWACQWCGYPLTSRAYKKIPKTYKQIKEEEIYGLESRVIPEPEVEPVVEPEPRPTPEPEPEPVPELESKPEPEPEAELVVEPEPRPTPEPELEPVPELESKPEPEQVVETESKQMSVPEPGTVIELAYKPIPELESRPVPEAEVEPESRPTPEPEPEAVPELESKPEAEPELVPVVKPELRPTSEPGPEPTVLEVTVGEIISDYEADAAAADAKFASKTLRVSGVVSRVEVKDAAEIYYINLTNEEENLMQNVRCIFNREHGARLNQLTMGQKVTVQGKYDGSVIDIRMRDCVLVE